MTGFRHIEYFPHALQRLRERGFTQSDVRWVLENGTKEPAWTPAGSAQRWLAVSTLENLRATREVGVIFQEDETRYIVVTVEWMD